MPNTGRNNSFTAPGAQINANVTMVVVAAPVALADVVMVAGDPGAADRSGWWSAHISQRTPSNQPRTQASGRHTPPGRATRPTPAASRRLRPTARKSTPP